MSKNTPILVVGHSSHDILINRENKVTKCLGGSAPYISNILTALNITHNVVSHVGHDFKYLYQCNFFPTFTKKSKTTAFININYYSRVQKVIECCTPIVPKDILYTADIAVVCGIFNEVLPITIEKLRSRSKILIADIQSFIRKQCKDRNIELSHINDTIYFKSIFLFDFLKMNDEEINYVDLDKLVQRGVKVIVTMADKGCYFYSQDFSTCVPVSPITPIDDTGAGDSFLAGFVAGLYNQVSIEEAIKLGHQCANIAIRSVGIPKRSQLTNLKLRLKNSTVNP